MTYSNNDTKSDLISNSLVSVIILDYNAGNLLLDCVSSILKSNHKNFEIIVVDNVSNDQSHKKCKEQFSDIILIEIVGNEGRRIGGERKMKRIQTGSRLFKRLMIEIFHNP